MIFNIGVSRDNRKYMPKFVFTTGGTNYVNNGEAKTVDGVYSLSYEGKTAGQENWNLKFFRSGTFTCSTRLPKLQVAAVGGGGGGSAQSDEAEDGDGGANQIGGAGGSGGQVSDGIIDAPAAGYTVTVGSGGSSGSNGTASSFGSISANGGEAGQGLTQQRNGENGTNPWGDTTCAKYGAGGGDGEHSYVKGGEKLIGTPFPGGATGGGDGGGYYEAGKDAAANTGSGGGGTGFNGGAGGKGGSGIVIIRNAR